MIRLLSGDCRDVLVTLPAESVQCVVTSPPYYGLRSYLDAEHADKRREIGSEATPEEYLATMVGVFREVRRVLRRDGTCWVNMGDSYSDKQLLLMPARLALALQADGWWVRSAIVWAKPNPMPESVSDRPTSAYEMVYLLARSARYYYDADAVREEPTGRTDMSRVFHTPLDGERVMREYPKDGCVGRNLRNVWTIATHAYPGAHFATFPPELAERCIKAGTSERGCCAACGKPWGRATEREAIALRPNSDTGWWPGCACNADVVPCCVLDPFAGAGTTLLVADRLQRDAVGVELNVAYTELAMERVRADAPLLAELGPAPEHPVETEIADLFAGDEYERRPGYLIRLGELPDPFKRSD